MSETSHVTAATADVWRQALREKAETMEAYYEATSTEADENHRVHIQARLSKLSWMVGANLVITLIMLWRLLAH